MSERTQYATIIRAALARAAAHYSAAQFHVEKWRRIAATG